MIINESLTTPLSSVQALQTAAQLSLWEDRE